MQKRHIVFATSGSLGDLYPFMALARQMQERGYRTSIATSKNYRSTVEGADINFFHMRPDPENTPDFHARYMHPKTGGEFVYRDYLAPAINESYNDLLNVTRNADVLVSQSLMALAAPLVAAKTGIPWISAVLQPMSFFSVHERPNYLPYPILPWLCGQSPAIHEQVFKYVRKYTEEWVRPVAELKGRIGIASDRHPMYEGQHSARCVLAMFSPLFGKHQPDWPSSAQQTGMAIYSSPKTDDLPDGLRAFLEQKSAPLAIFTLSTAACNDAGDFYKEGLQAAGDLGMRALLVMSGLASKASLPDPLPKWAFRIDYAPFEKIFPYADVIVHAGGIGSAFKALQAGAPQILVPHAHDQLDNAIRLEKLGVAIVIGKNRAKRRVLRNSLRKALAGKMMHHTAQALSIQARNEDGAARACDVIEKACSHV